MSITVRYRVQNPAAVRSASGLGKPKKVEDVMDFHSGRAELGGRSTTGGQWMERPGWEKPKKGMVYVWTSSAPIYAGRVSILELPDVNTAGKLLVPVTNSTTAEVDIDLDMDDEDAIVEDQLDVDDQATVEHGRRGAVVRYSPLPSTPTKADNTAQKLEHRRSPASGHHNASELETPRKVRFSDEHAKASNKIGLFVQKLTNPIRYLKAHTAWFYQNGPGAIPMPPMLSNKVVLEVGDVYIHVHNSKSKQIDVRQIWILQQDDNGKRYWQQAEERAPHPVLQDRYLAFQAQNDTIPSWVKGNTLRRKDKQPAIMVPGDEQSMVKAQNVVTQTFTDAMNALSANMRRLVIDAEISLADLERLEQRLISLNAIISREDSSLSSAQSELLSDLWTRLGGNRQAVRGFEEHRALLRNIGSYRQRALAHVVAALQTLQSMSEDMEDLRERVAAPELVGDRIPVEVHMRSIRAGLDRIQERKRRAERPKREDAVEWLTS
ncbi:hypothetical protein FA95DRAFT_1598489 [Auriscalpium vulgare]|uniref:Uncharacterized protein n=1 Tax=Auriscalpium vulgare TaxID=40419 RepID=A0ACB8RE05_9AGAM|nr:hypothetical protein FA95DRAFT_1598489 [Auriscalpium vulgare]